MSTGMRSWRCPQCGVVIVTTDPQVVLPPLVACNLWHEPDGTDHRGDALPWAKDEKMTAPLSIDRILELKRERDEARTIARRAVPTNWTDPLLTGPDGIGQPPYDCRHIEKLLRGIQDRLDALYRAKEP